MRVFTNEQLLRRNRQIAQFLFIFSLVILIGGLIITNTAARDNTALMVIPLLIMPVGLITTWISVRLTNLYVREPHPADALQAALKGVSRQSVLYNYLFKAQHVLICPQGVYAIVTRFQDGTFRAQGETVRSARKRSPFSALFVLMRQEQLGNPIKDARAAAADLQTRIDALLPDAKIVVQPVVAFISDKAQIDEASPAVPVVLANIPKSGSAVKKPSFKGLLRDKKQSTPALSFAQIARLEAGLNTSLSIGEAQGRVVEDEA